MLLAFSRARAVEPGVWRTLRRGRAVLGMASPSESWSSRLRKGYSRKPGGGKPRATSNSADEPLGGDPLLPVTRGLWTRRQLHGGVRAASPRPRRLADRHRLVQQPPRLWHVARQNNARGRARRAGRGARRPRRAAALPRRAVRLPRFGGKRRYGARRGRAGARRPARLALLLRPGGWAIGTAASTSRTRWSASSATGHCFRPTSSPPTITNWSCWRAGRGFDSLPLLLPFARHCAPAHDRASLWPVVALAVTLVARLARRP